MSYFWALIKLNLIINPAIVFGLILIIMLLIWEQKPLAGLRNLNKE